MRIKKWVGQKGIEKIVQRIFPDTRFWVQSGGWERYRIWWARGLSYEDVRALTDEIEAAVPAKSNLSIECCREKTDPPWPMRKWQALS